MAYDRPTPLNSDFDRKGIPPIEQLPEEILHMIFMLCLPDPRYRANLSPAAAPVLLTHVCHYWRESARGLPALWSSLDAELLLFQVGKQFPDPQECDIDAFYERLTSWFSLNGDNQFTLQFTCDEVAWRRWRTLKAQFTKHTLYEEAALEALSERLHGGHCILAGLTYRLLAPISRTLTNLTLRNVPLLELQRLTRGSFPMLERLGLSLFVGKELKDVDLDPSISPLYAFVDSPRLRCVAAKYLPPADHIQLPWAQLTHFVEFKCLPDPTWNFLYTHIHSATSLRHLHVSLDEFHARHSCNIPGWQAGRSTLPFAPVFLPELRKLSVYCPRSYCSTMKPDF